MFKSMLVGLMVMLSGTAFGDSMVDPFGNGIERGSQLSSTPGLGSRVPDSILKMVEAEILKRCVLADAFDLKLEFVEKEKLGVDAYFRDIKYTIVVSAATFSNEYRNRIYVNVIDQRQSLIQSFQPVSIDVSSLDVFCE
ncbi:MAG: hypothetical protein ACLGG7_00460 [Bacteriovoracia bacterium]